MAFAPACPAQDLATGDLPDLRRLYFQGIGLRIEPNDLLAAELAPQEPPVPLRVESAKEINDEKQGSITVVTIVGDQLSADRLIADVDALIHSFLLLNRGLIDDAEFKEVVQDPLLFQIQRAKRDRPFDRLQGTDERFQNELVIHLLVNELPKFFGPFIKWFSLSLKDFDPEQVTEYTEREGTMLMLTSEHLRVWSTWLTFRHSACPASCLICQHRQHVEKGHLVRRVGRRRCGTQITGDFEPESPRDSRRG